MSQPTPYTPTSDFSQQEANNASGRSTVNTAALDVEFANIETTLDTTLANLALIQRDDGKLKDEGVEVHTLSRDVLNLIGGFVNRGDWVTATAYSVKDIVSVSGYLYQCSVGHVSSASFVTDAAKWIKFGFAPADSSASAAAQASINAHIDDVSGAHQASAIQYGATTVSAALDTIESEKADILSPAFSGTPTAPTPSSSDISTKIATTAFVANSISAINSALLPSQSGNSGKVLKTNGESVSWGSNGALGTSVASTSGSAIDFTSIPSWVKRITIMFNGVSTSGVGTILVRIGAGSVDSSGYISGCLTQNIGGAIGGFNSTSGFVVIVQQDASNTFGGSIVLTTLGSNAWVASVVMGANSYASVAGGNKSLSGALDRVQIVTTDAFDAGSINILYE